MIKKKKWKILCFLIGFLLIIVGVLLMALAQNLHLFNSSIAKVFSFLHNKLIFDYLLLISGSILISIAFFSNFFSAATQIANLPSKKTQIVEN